METAIPSRSLPLDGTRAALRRELTALRWGALLGGAAFLAWALVDVFVVPHVLDVTLSLRLACASVAAVVSFLAWRWSPWEDDLDEPALARWLTGSRWSAAGVGLLFVGGTVALLGFVPAGWTVHYVSACVLLAVGWGLGWPWPLRTMGALQAAFAGIPLLAIVALGGSPLDVASTGLLMGAAALVGTATSALRYRELRQRVGIRGELSRAASEARIEAEANRAKNLFLARMSHELRTPLNAILGYAELLLEEHDRSSDADGDLERIVTSGQQLLSLIDDLLEMANIEANEVVISIEQVDLEAITREVVSRYVSWATRQRLDLRCVVEPDARSGLADPVRFAQIIRSLLHNAIRFTERGWVTVQLSRASDGALVLIVEDSGVGIEPDRVDEMFEPFTQADDLPTQVLGGAGLGLSIVRNLVRLHGGTIRATSEVGVGSCFEVRLPQDEVREPGLAPRVLLS